MSLVFKSTVIVFSVLVAHVSYINADDNEEWDAFARDKTEFCEKMSRYVPTAEMWCERFQECCESMFDPINGDKCQVKQVECVPAEQGATGYGTCKFTNCTEKITTTTTTTTTPMPVMEAINSMAYYGSMTACITTIIAYLVI